MIFSLEPSPFWQRRLWKTKSLWGLELVIILFRVANFFRKISFLVIYHLGKFDDSIIQSGFWVIPNITFANLCRPIHDIIIIPVSSNPYNLKTEEREKMNTSKPKKLLRWNKKAFFIIFEMLSFAGKILKTEDTILTFISSYKNIKT